MRECMPHGAGRGVSLRPLLAAGAILGAAVVYRFVSDWGFLAFGLSGAGNSPASAPGFTPFNAAFLRSMAPQALALLLLCYWAGRFARRIGRGVRADAAAAPRCAGAESGASVIEFALMLPFLLTLLLLILQIALIVQAKFVVNYAAFCAVRSAIVTIPAKIYSTQTRRYEKNNQLDLNNPASPKMSIIRRAAALPCTAVSPVLGPRVFFLTDGTLLPFSHAEELGKVALFFPSTGENLLIGGELVKRASYAYDKKNTQVEIVRESGEGRHMSDHDLVTARVTFRYYLAVPIAGRMIGTAYRPGLVSYFFGSAYYAAIHEQYTLPLEGEPLGPGAPESWPDEVETEVFE